MTQWRVIELEEHDAYINMAVDEAILENVRDGKASPTIRFYRWHPSAVSIGRFQSMQEEVRVGACRDLGVGYVRRITGGGAVYHDYDGELTYSIIGKEGLFSSGIHDSYRQICGYVVNGLKRIGIESQFVPINDVITNGKKISGNAQTRREGVLLQHGTILYKLDISRMFLLLNVSKEKVSDKMVKSVEERVTSVCALSAATFAELYASMFKSFTDGKEFSIGKLSQDEMHRAQELSKRYSSDEWNLSR